jgi:hypothetical protein
MATKSRIVRRRLLISSENFSSRVDELIYEAAPKCPGARHWSVI